MNILITGANGQLGNELKILSKEYPAYHYIFTDVDELNICDEEAVSRCINEKQIELIINCAAFTNVDGAEKPENRELCENLNGKAPGYLAKAAQQAGAVFIHISTDYVFDGDSFVPYQEDDKKHPMSVYGTTKLKGEENVIAACKKHVIIRTAWLYSPFGKNFVKTMLKLSRERSELGVVFDQIGTPTYARDLAKAIFVIIEKGITPGVYHFSNEGVCSWFDFAKAILRIGGISGCKVKPLHTNEYPAPAKRPACAVLDKTKIKKTYGIDIPQWEESLVDCIKRLKNLEK